MINSKAWVLGLLLILSVICSASLAYVNAKTGPVILRNAEQKQMTTVLDVLGVPYEKADPESIPRMYKDRITEETVRGITVFREKESGKTALLMSGSGFQGPITVVAALDGETMSGFLIVSQSETPGLGSRITEEQFTKQFIGKKVSGGITYVKSGNAGPSEFDAVTGATESSKALARILNSGFRAYFNVKTTVEIPKNLNAKYMDALLEVFGIPRNAGDSLAVRSAFEKRVTVSEKNGQKVYLDTESGASALFLGGSGYQSTIVLAVALKGDTISGFKVVDQNESPGVGSRIMEEVFQKQFVGKKVSGGITPVKTGNVGPAEFDAVSRATISSNAVAGILNDGFSTYYNVKIDIAAAKIAGPEKSASAPVSHSPAPVPVVSTVPTSSAVSAGPVAHASSSPAEHKQVMAGGGALAMAKSNDKPDVATTKNEETLSPGKDVGDILYFSGMGFQDTITVMVEVKNETIKNFKVVKQNETPGMGDQILKEDFQYQFIGKNISKGITLVKTGKAGPAEFDAISGATLSSEAIGKILNSGIQAYHKKHVKS